MRETSLTKMAICGFLSMKNPVKWDMAGTKDLIFTQLVIFFFTKCETSGIWFIQFSAGTISGGTTNTAIHDEFQPVLVTLTADLESRCSIYMYIFSSNSFSCSSSDLGWCMDISFRGNIISDQNYNWVIIPSSLLGFFFHVQ